MENTPRPQLGQPLGFFPASFNHQNNYFLTLLPVGPHGLVLGPPSAASTNLAAISMLTTQICLSNTDLSR